MPKKGHKISVNTSYIITFAVNVALSECNLLNYEGQKV